MKSLIKSCFLVGAFFVSCVIFAADVKSQNAEMAKAQIVNVKSDCMKSEFACAVVLPESYDSQKDKRYPVIYLLHGYGGNHTQWIKIKPDLHAIATEKQVIFVCPDGKTSWYWDSPKIEKLKFETYVAKELIPYIDANYRTIASPSGRAITGLSMGGQGGLWLGFNHPELFGACGSTSGGVDITKFPTKWSMAKSLGEYADNKEIWDSRAIVSIVEKVNPKQFRIIIDCGTSDFFYEVNKALHEKMLTLKIPHDYIERPGGHNQTYWNNSIDYQILFFSKFFNEAKK